ncbi:MAG: hypothetical protein R3301_17220, partial [Saprospiraceae bacterium]|nr:hypothetical protein [Saprospiraceae bacterium]
MRKLLILFLVHVSSLPAITQNVGIGTDTPVTTLQVVGTVLTDTLVIPTHAGHGRFLRSDSAGTASWQSLADTHPDAQAPAVTGYLGVFAPSLVKVQGDYAYVISVDDDLWVIDISNPASPMFIGEVDLSAGNVSMTISNDHIFVVEQGTNRLVAVDVTDP